MTNRAFIGTDCATAKPTGFGFVQPYVLEDCESESENENDSIRGCFRRCCC